jgi:hypothetical protein
MVEANNTNKLFWDNFYSKNNKIIEKPSSFSKFIYKYIKKQKEYKEYIIDLGCGNGRDLNFFRSKNLPCLGIDKSNIAAKKLNKNKKKIVILNDDFTDFNFDKICYGNYSLYSRFTWHSINYNEESRLLKNLKKAKKIKFLFIETRSIHDELYGIGKKVGRHEYVDDHYRRFIDPEELKKKIEKNFKIILFKIRKGVAKFKNEDPCIIRIIAIKK